MQSPSPLESIFAPQDCHERGTLPIAKRLLHYLGIEAAKLSQFNKALYEAIHGEAFTFLQGTQDRYALFRGFRPRHIGEIFKQTGWQVHWPLGEPCHEVGKHKAVPARPSYRVEGSKGTFRIGWAFNKGAYVGIKITKGGMEEFRAQIPLQGLPHILAATDCCASLGPKGEALNFQVMELAGLGSVADLLPNLLKLTDPTFKENLRFYLIKNAVMGIHYMHTRQVFHLDIKPENMVITHRAEVKLIDFGCSRKTQGKMIDCFSTSSDGDERYFSPERWLASYGAGSLCDGSKVDAWAFGVSFLEILGWRTDPFDYRRLRDLAVKGGSESGRSALFRHFSQKLMEIPELFDPDPEGPWAIVAHLLAISPADRITISEALQYPWFAIAQTSFQAEREKTLSHLTEFVQYRKLDNASGVPEWELFSPQQLPLPHFTDYISRPSLEGRLVNALQPNSSPIPLSGGGGFGKTSLIARVIHLPEVRERYGHILWFRQADTPSHLDIQYLVLAREWGLVDPRAPLEEARQALFDYLNKSPKPWLAILDNAGPPNQLILPSGGTCVVTTRSGEWSNAIPIGALDVEEAKALVIQLLGKEDPSAARLAEALGGHPLGLVQACAYIRNTASTLEAYLKLLTDSPNHLLNQNQPSFGKELPASISSVWEASFNAVERLSPRSLELLLSLAYYAPDNIPQPLALGIAKDRTLLLPLLNYSLLIQGREGYSIHRLLQVVLQTWTKDPIPLAKALESLNQLYNPTPSSLDGHRLNRTLLPHGEALYRHCTTSPSAPTYQLQELLCTLNNLNEEIGRHTARKQYINHYEQLTKTVGKGDLREEAEIHFMRGSMHLDAHSLEEAKVHFKKALTTLIKANSKLEAVPKNLGKPLGSLPIDCRSDLLDAGRYLNSLGAACSQSEQLELAEGYYKRTLEIWVAARGTDHRDIASTLFNMGSLCLRQRRYKEALSYYEEAYAIRQRILPPEDAHIIFSLGGFGGLYHTLGQHEKAVPWLEKAYRLNVQIGGLQHPMSGELANLLGISLINLGRDNEAIRLFETIGGGEGVSFEQALQQLCTRQNGLGVTLYNQGKYKEAVAAYAVAANSLKGHSSRHPTGYVSTLTNMGVAYSNFGQPEEAAKCYQEALKIGIPLLGKDHSAIANTRINYGVALRQLGQLGEAKKQQEMALKVQSQEKEKESVFYALSLMKMGDTLRELGERERGLQYCAQAVETFHKELATDHPYLAEGYYSLGLCWASQGDSETAQVYLQMACSTGQSNPQMGSHHPKTLKYRQALKD
ncbi:MAG: tetratricopeptide repeat protein [Parachlamydiales bacterium]